MDCKTCANFSVCYRNGETISDPVNYNTSNCNKYVSKMTNTMYCLSNTIYRNCNRDHIENCVIEEMSELTKAVIKSKRGKIDIDNIAEEIGHVILMCNALMKSYCIPEEWSILEAKDAVDRMLKAKENK